MFFSSLSAQAQKCPFANECVFGVNPSGQWKAINLDSSGNLLMNMSGGGGFVAPAATCPFPGACPQAVTPTGAFAPLQLDASGNLYGNCQSGCTGTGGALPSTWSSNGTTNITAGPTSVLDLSAITTGQFKAIAAANGVATAAQQLVFDSNAGLMHAWNGADSILPQSKGGVSHQWISSYSMTTGIFAQSQPACGDLSNSTPLCSTSPATNVATFLATPTSANLAAALTDEVSVGTGKALFATAFLGTDANAVTGTGVFSVSNMACGDANAGVTPCLALPSGMTATTQTSSDNTNDVATDAFVQAAISGISGGLPSLPTGPNGVPEVLNSTPSGGLGGSASWGLAGVPFNNNSETTCSGGTLSALDRATAIFCSGGTTATFTLPVHTTSGLGSNFPFVIGNNNSGTLTMTPTTDTIDNGTVLSKWASFTYNDASGNWHTLQFPQFAAFGSTCTNGLTWSTSTGFSCASSAPLVSGGALGTPSSGTGTNIAGIPAANVLSGTFASGMAASTQSADDNSTKLATTAYVDRMKARTVTFTFGAPEGSTLSSPLTRYVTVPFGCTISAYNLLADAGTFTVKFWKIATGTAIPTVSNSISTSGLSLASGTALHSTTLTDFTTTTVASNDIIAANLTTVATAKMVQAQVECDQ